MSNNPPIESRGAATFTLIRANGDIEIRGMTPEHLWDHQKKHPDHKFGEMEQLTPSVWAVRGGKHGVV